MSALQYRFEDLDEAFKRGLITDKSRQWAKEPLKIYDKGAIKRLTRHELVRMGMRQGLNATQTMDTLYRNSIQRIPLIGERWNEFLAPANKWIFERMTPGAMAEAFVDNIERINASNRHLSLKDQIREVVRDTNVFFGNLGRNGIFRNPTTRDMFQIFLLAPLWQEGLLAKEMRTASRATGVSWLLGRRGLGANVYFGPLVRGMVRGLASYFILSQMINLATRRKFTWENEEPGHKMDAWLGVNGNGVWLSPLGVFGELSDTLIRLGQSRPTVWDAISQVGRNKLGPIGRLAAVMWDAATPTGEKITTTPGVLGAAAKELAPAPISLGTGIKMAAHAVAPQRFPPARPGEPIQRAMSFVGIKTQLPTRADTDIRRLAERFVKANNLSYEPLRFTPTDQASFAKLRGAIRNDDFHSASKILAELRQHKSDAQILKSMQAATTRPYSGSAANERLFMSSLSDKELNLYFAANMERHELLQKFMNWYVQQP